MSISLFWKILYCISFVLYAFVLLIFFGVMEADYIFLPLIFSILFLVFFLNIHLYLTTISKTLLFFTIALFVSFTYDKLLINNILYEYNPSFLHFFNIPIAALLTWSAGIAQVYHFNNGLLYWLKLDKPIFIKKEFLKLGLMVILDGFNMMTIGFFMEYNIVKYGYGKWLGDMSLLFGLPIKRVLVSYFIVGAAGSGFFRAVEFFKNDKNIPPFNAYLQIFGLIYLICFLISCYVLFDVNFSPIFVFISVLMLLILLLNDRLGKRKP